MPLCQLKCPSSTPKVSSQAYDLAQTKSSGDLLQMWQSWSLGEELSFTPPGLYLNCGQAGHCRIKCLCLPEANQSIKFFIHRKVSWIFWAWKPKTEATLGISAPHKPNKANKITGESPGVTDQVSISRSLSFQLTQWPSHWFVLPFLTYPSQISDGVGG